jgi:hypothetical protein
VVSHPPITGFEVLQRILVEVETQMSQRREQP